MKYLALLRGINVGGHRVIMTDLKKMFEEMGFQDVKTFIQTGNVFFETSETKIQKLQDQIQNFLQLRLGYEVQTFIKTKDQMQSAVDHYEKKIEELTDTYRHYVNFLEKIPKNIEIQELEKQQTNEEIYHVFEDIAFVSLHKERSDPRYKMPVEKILKMKATTRNWSVLCKLAKLF